MFLLEFPETNLRNKSPCYKIKKNLPSYFMQICHSEIYEIYEIQWKPEMLPGMKGRDHTTGEKSSMWSPTQMPPCLGGVL